MHVELLVTGKGYSFTNQARALQAALQTAGVEASLLQLNQSTHYQPAAGTDLAVPIGAWQDYDTIIAPARAAGVPTLPWLVADVVLDGTVVVMEPSIAERLSQLPALLTPSEYCRQNFLRSGLTAERVDVMPECVDEQIWQPAAANGSTAILDYLSIDEETRTALPLHFNLRRAKAEGVPILFTTGGNATNKGVPETLQALGKLNPALEWLYIIKTWPSAKSFTDGTSELQAAADNHIAPRVRYISGEFSGQFLVDLMNLCDIYVAPSHSEGFGLPLVEAQLCGKMVVTHDATATAEVVLPDETGLVARADVRPTHEAFANIDDLSHQLERAIRDTELRQRLSATARPSAIERFGREAIGRRFAARAQAFLDSGH